MSRLWLINGWRHHYSSQKALLAGIQQAKLLGLDSYCSQRYGQQWWLCCAPVGARQQQQQDIVAALRQQFQHALQVVAVLQHSQQWVCVCWDHQQLLAAIAVSNDDSGCQQVQLVLQGVWQRSGFQPLCLVSPELPEALQQWLDEVPHTRLQQFSLGQLQPHKTAQLQLLSQLPSWRRRWQLLLITMTLIGLITTLSWYYWPASARGDSGIDASQLAVPLVGMPVDSLLLIREQLQQLELLAGWQVEQLSLHDDQLVVLLRQGYGRFGELRQQLQPHWQIRQTAQQVQLQRNLASIGGELEFNQSLSQAQQQLHQQLLLLLPEVHWHLGSTGITAQHYWQDLSVRFDSWYWLELSDVQQLLQGFDVRVMQLKLSRQPQSQVAMELRLYQPVMATDDIPTIGQGETDDTTLDVSSSSY